MKAFCKIISLLLAVAFCLSSCGKPNDEPERVPFVVETDKDGLPIRLEAYRTVFDVNDVAIIASYGYEVDANGEPIFDVSGYSSFDRGVESNKHSLYVGRLQLERMWMYEFSSPEFKVYREGDGKLRYSYSERIELPASFFKADVGKITFYISCYVNNKISETEKESAGQDFRELSFYYERTGSEVRFLDISPYVSLEAISSERVYRNVFYAKAESEQFEFDKSSVNLDYSFGGNFGQDMALEKAEGYNFGKAALYICNDSGKECLLKETEDGFTSERFRVTIGEDGKAVYSHTEKITVPEELFEDEFGSLLIRVASDDANTDNEGGKTVVSVRLYYRVIGERVQLSDMPFVW